MENYKFDYKNVLVVLILLLILSSALYLLFFFNTGKLGNKIPTITEKSSNEKKQVFTISTQRETFPRFTGKLIITPYEVKNGEKQTFEVSIEDPKGIASLKGKVYTEEGEIEIDFIKKSKDGDVSSWEGSWIAQGIGEKSHYKVTLTALSESGEKENLDFFFRSKKQ